MFEINNRFKYWVLIKFVLIFFYYYIFYFGYVFSLYFLLKSLSGWDRNEMDLKWGELRDLFLILCYLFGGKREEVCKIYKMCGSFFLNFWFLCFVCL